MKTRRIILILGLCLASSATFAAKDVEFNYEGRVLVDEMPYTGNGYFKFAIVLGSGEKTVWSNDGTSEDGAEPASAVVVSVTEGVFNVIIGDTSIDNMEALSASIFNNKKDYYLRVWFSDSGDQGTFEHLAPDRRITDAGVLGLQSDSETVLYVDPALGDDDNHGQREDKPKKTIQAAWDALPTLLNESATIHLADGIYREQVLLKGKTVIGDATISIIGNLSNPDLVRVTGADEDDETTPVRGYGFVIDSQNNLKIAGIRFEYHSEAGVFLNNYSTATVDNCHIDHAWIGVHVVKSDLKADSLDIANGISLVKDPAFTRQCGVRVDFSSSGEITNSIIDAYETGIFVQKNSSMLISGGNSISNCSNAGCYTNINCFLSFRSRTGIRNSFLNNPSRHIAVSNNSYAAYEAIGNTYDGSGPAVVVGAFSTSWNP